MFDDWTTAQKMRFSLSGLAALAIYLLLFGFMALVLDRYFPIVDEHVGAIVAQAVSVPLGILCGGIIYKFVMFKVFPDDHSIK